MGPELLVVVPIVVLVQLLASAVALVIDAARALADSSAAVKQNPEWSSLLATHGLCSPRRYWWHLLFSSWPTLARDHAHSTQHRHADASGAPHPPRGTALTDLSHLPVEVQLLILRHLASPTVGQQATKVLCLSRGHKHVFQRHVYRCVRLSSAHAVERLRVTLLLLNPPLGRLVERIQIQTVVPCMPLHFSPPTAPRPGMRAQSRQLALEAVWQTWLALVSRTNPAPIACQNAKQPDPSALPTLARHVEQILEVTPRVRDVSISGPEARALQVTGAWARLGRTCALSPRSIMTAWPSSSRWQGREEQLLVHRMLSQPVFSGVDHFHFLVPGVCGGMDLLRAAVPQAKVITLHWTMRDHTDLGTALEHMLRALYDLRCPQATDRWDELPLLAHFDRINVWAPPLLARQLVRLLPDARWVSDCNSTWAPRTPTAHFDHDGTSHMAPVFVGTAPDNHDPMADWCRDLMTPAWAH